MSDPTQSAARGAAHHGKTEPEVRPKVLRCGGCGAPVRLGDGVQTQCEQCERTVDVPEQHRALRDAQRRDVEARAEADAQYRLLSRPPSRPLRVAAAFLDVNFMWLLPYSVVVVNGSAWLLQIAGVVPAAVSWDGTLVVSSYLAMPPFLLVVRALAIGWSVKARGRLMLADALAAVPPPRPGAALRCRGCGAPLEQVAGAAVVPCLYCRTDNALVSQRRTRVHVARSVSLTRTVAEAVAVDAAERAEARRQMGAFGVRAFGTSVAILLVPTIAAVAFGHLEAVPWFRRHETELGLLAIIVGVATLIRLYFYARRWLWADAAATRERRQGHGVPRPLVVWVHVIALGLAGWSLHRVEARARAASAGPATQPGAEVWR